MSSPEAANHWRIPIALLALCFATHPVNAAQPSGVRHTERSPAHLRVEWSVESIDEGRFRVYRRRAGSDAWRVAGETPTTHFDDGGLQAATRYEHKVVVLTGAHEGSPAFSTVGTTSRMSPNLSPQFIVPRNAKTFPAAPTALVSRKHGLLLVYSVGDRKHRRRWWNTGLWLQRSPDAGDTWSDACEIVSGNRKTAFAKPALLRLAKDEIGLSYSRFGLNADGRIVSRSKEFILSRDEGMTWSEPVTMGPNSSNNDTLIRAADGRLLQALSGYTPGAQLVCSDDRGESWRNLSEVFAKRSARPTGEAALAHLGSGKLVFLSRHEAPFYCLNVSNDNGATWSGPKTLWLGGGDNPPKIIRIPDSATLVAIVHSWRPGGRVKDRRQLASLISRDGGRTWDNFRLIGFSPDGTDGFLQHSITFVGDTAYLFYGGGHRHDTADGHDLRLIRLHKAFFTSRTEWPYDWQGDRAR